MEEYIGKRCPYCSSECKEDDEIILCPECGTPHHKDCWERGGGCYVCANNGTTPLAEAVEAEVMPADTEPAPAEVPPEEPAYAEVPPVEPAKTPELCQNCGAEIPEGRPFCPMCGTPKPVASSVPAKIPEICQNCGAEIPDGRPFCPMCGTPKPVGPMICRTCGAEIPEGRPFCPMCGTPADAGTNAIAEYNANLGTQKKTLTRNKKIIIIIAVALVAIIAFVSILNVVRVMREERSEELTDEYIETAEEFLSTTSDAAVNLEDVADTVLAYLYVYSSSRSTKAISDAKSAKSSELSDAATYDTKVKNLYNQLRDIPDGLVEDDEKTVQKIYSAVKALYEAYEDYHDLVYSSTGSYSSYKTSKSNYTSAIIDAYTELQELLD